MALRSCSSCEGFVPEEAGRCPHCDAAGAPAPRAGGPVAKAAVAMSMVTLMACYGAGPQMRGIEPRSPNAVCSPVDRDGDGFFVCAEGEGALPREKDCDDANPQIYPGAGDPPGDGVDQSCDGVDGAITVPTGAPSPAGAPAPASGNVIAR